MQCDLYELLGVDCDPMSEPPIFTMVYIDRSAAVPRPTPRFYGACKAHLGPMVEVALRRSGDGAVHVHPINSTPSGGVRMDWLHEATERLGRHAADLREGS